MAEKTATETITEGRNIFVRGDKDIFGCCEWKLGVLFDQEKASGGGNPKRP